MFSAKASEGTRDNVENQFKYRLGAEIEAKIIKGLKAYIAPELRYNDGFERFNLEGGLSYKTFKCIYWGASYRFDMYRYEGVTNNFTGKTEYDWETLHRYAFDVSYKDSFKRFTPSLRIRFNNYTDEQEQGEACLRYRAKLSYKIKKSRFTPSIYTEAYHDLSLNKIYKMRYGHGWAMKFGKFSTLSVDYKFDFFRLKYTNAHILSTGYKFAF